MLEQDGVIVDFHAALHLAHAVAQGVDAVECGTQDVLYRRTRFIDRNLVDDADRAVLCDGDRAALIRQFACQDAEQRGLSRAVRSDNRNLFPGKDIKGDVMQDLIFSEKLVQTLNTDVSQGESPFRNKK